MYSGAGTAAVESWAEGGTQVWEADTVGACLVPLSSQDSSGSTLVPDTTHPRGQTLT